MGGLDPADWVGLEGNEAQAGSAHHGLGARPGAQFAEHRVHVKLDGVLADVQPLGDELVGQALGQQEEDLDLPGGEWFGEGCGRRSLGTEHAWTL